ncbi:MAG: hypothetical protein WCP70_10530 [Methanothrix sp.]
MAIGRRSDNSESNGAIMGFEAMLWAAADKLRNNTDRKKQIKILGLNLGIAAADIITFSPGLLGIEMSGGASALATAFGSTIIFLSAVGVIYGNYRLLARPEKSIPTAEDYIEALNRHRGLKTFEETINLAIDQIVRLQKKNKNILLILPQIFGDSEITCNKFIAAIAEMKNAFFMNIRNILNKLDTFDEEDYNFIREKHEAGVVSQLIMRDKFEVYNEYVTSVKAATEDNEQILLMLDKLLLRISDLKCPDSGQRDQMAEMIDDLIKQLKYYKK